MHTNAKKLLSRTAIGIFVIVVIVYALYQARGILSGPQITLERPADGITATTSLITVSGNITRASSVFLNDKAIYLDLGGRFREELLLSAGYNIIEVRAEDGAGRVVRVTRTLHFR